MQLTVIWRRGRALRTYRQRHNNNTTGATTSATTTTTATNHNNTSRAQQQEKGIIKGGAGVSPRLSEASEQLAKQVGARLTQSYSRARDSRRPRGTDARRCTQQLARRPTVGGGPLAGAAAVGP